MSSLSSLGLAPQSTPAPAPATIQEIRREQQRLALLAQQTTKDRVRNLLK